MIQLIACTVYTNSLKENELLCQSEVIMGWLQIQGAGFTTSANRLSISRKSELKFKKWHLKKDKQTKVIMQDRSMQYTIGSRQSFTAH